MMLIRTPESVAIFGRHTLNPEWKKAHGGLMLGFAFNKYSYVLHTERFDPRFKDKRQFVEAHDMLLAGSTTGDSHTCNFQLSRRALAGQSFTREQIAKEGESAGRLCSISAIGGIGVVHGRANRNEYHKLNLSTQVSNEFKDNLILFCLETVLGSIVETEGNVDASKTQEMHAITRTTEAAIHSIYSRNWEKVGALMDLAMRATTHLGLSGMTEKVNDLYAKARVSGAWGGVLDGNLLVLMAPKDKRDKVIDAVSQEVQHIPFEFDFHGTTIVWSDPDKLSQVS